MIKVKEIKAWLKDFADEDEVIIAEARQYNVKRLKVNEMAYATVRDINGNRKLLPIMITENQSKRKPK